MATVRDEAEESLARMQNFDVSTLPRVGELGSTLSFDAVVPKAQRLVDLYKRLSISSLEDLSQTALTQVRDRANSDFSFFKQILDFNPGQGNPQSTRQGLINQVDAAYDPTFQTLHPYIAYSLHRAADFQRLDAQARATMQSVSDQADKLTERLNGHDEEAERILGEIRKVAAEQGVSQQAVHFKTEADRHDTQADKWRETMRNYAIAVGVYAVASVFVHKIPWLTPSSYYETVQLAISKILIFSVLAYMLLNAARNFMGHKHNAIINRHRQNALMTHKALIEAVSDPGVREAIMVQAAGSIFAAQPTGYATDGAGEGSAAKAVVELLSKRE